MSIQKALEIIVEMAAVYGVTLEPPALRAWRRVLDGYDVRDVEAAAAAWMRSEKWMPKPSEFVERVRGTMLARVRMEQERTKEWARLTLLAVDAECSLDASEMLSVADALERAGRTARAQALRRRAHALRGEGRS